MKHHQPSYRRECESNMCPNHPGVTQVDAPRNKDHLLAEHLTRSFTLKSYDLSNDILLIFNEKTTGTPSPNLFAGSLYLKCVPLLYYKGRGANPGLWNIFREDEIYNLI